MSQKERATVDDGTADVNALLAEAQKTVLVPDALLKALEIMAMREVRLSQKEEALEKQRKAIDAERRKESERYMIERIAKQSNCKHLKGGRFRSKGQQADPAVYHHRFTNGDQAIKCTLCHAKWTPQDTKEFLYRNGHKITNWTKKGWEEALQLAEESSNRPSSSEQFSVTEVNPDAVKQKIEGLDTPDLQF